MKKIAFFRSIFVSLFLITLSPTSFAQDTDNSNLPGVGQYTAGVAGVGLFSKIMHYDIGTAAVNGGRALMRATPGQVAEVGVVCWESKVACAGVAATGATLSYAYMHPESVADFIEGAPEKANTVWNFFSQKEQNATDQVTQSKAANVLDVINYSTQAEQDALEGTQEFNDTMILLTDIANQLDNNMKDETRNCNITVTQNLLLDNRLFNTTINPKLPKINDSLSTIGNTDAYNNLIPKSSMVERDHIPSYKAIEFYLKQRGVSFTGLKISGNRYTNLANNETAMNLEYNLHRNNRTTGTKNGTYYPQDGQNQATLRRATLKDFATILVKADPVNYQTYLKAFPVIYTRNALLCLYN
jgi:hypothetical protein